MNIWQPIETAPKDGTPLLLWWDSKPVISYYAERVGFKGWQPPSMMPIKVGGRSAWNPTHWMPLPSSPSEAVAYLSFDLPIWQQHEHRIRRLMTDLGMSNSLSLFEAMKQLIRDVEYIDKNTRPVSLDREAVARAVRNGVYFDGDDREVKGFDDAADNVLALIEGRT